MAPRAPRVAALVALLLLASAAGAAARPRPCPEARGFVCDAVVVPVDRTGAVPGTVAVHFAAQDRLRHGKVLVALTGGPGQDGIPFGPAFAHDLAPALRDHRLVVLDQRGTGRSGALSCPELQGTTALQVLLPEDVAGCARRLGPRRNGYASIDTADDLEVVRQALKVPKLALYGVSYGTWVAQQYARRYPDHVESLLLDSVVPDETDPWDLRITQSLPRVLRGLCSGGRCAGITADPVADLAAVIGRIRAQGRLRATVRDLHGGRRQVLFSEYDLLSTLVAADLNPWLQARLPGALAASARGDDVPLARLRRDAAGPPQDLAALSAGLYATTTCLDQPLPYAFSEPPPQREADEAAALAALPNAALGPFDRATVDLSSAPQICLEWPDGPYRPEAAGPLPDVPALVLSGLADTRTPLEGAETTARELPHATVVTVAGVGHSVLAADTSGCARLAIARFYAGRRVGQPCRGVDDELPLAPAPPLRLADVPGTAGVPGMAGRVLRAAVATVGDARTSANESLFAGFEDDTGGGLRGGSFVVLPTTDGDVLVLRRMVYVPGVIVDGAVVSVGGRFSGRIDVQAPDGLSGELRLVRGGASGRLGRRRVRASAAALVRARVSRTGRASASIDGAMGLGQLDTRFPGFAGPRPYAYAWRFR